MMYAVLSKFDNYITSVTLSSYTLSEVIRQAGRQVVNQSVENSIE